MSKDEVDSPIDPEAVHKVPDTEAGRHESLAQKIRSIEAAAVAGVLFAVIGAIALALLSSFPDLDQGEPGLKTWFADSGNQTTLIFGANLMVFSSIMFLWFVAVIRRRLGDLEDQFFGTVFLGSAFAFVAVWLGHGAAVAGPAVAVSHFEGASVTGPSLSNAAGLGAAYLLVIGPRVEAVFVLVTSVLFLRSRVLPTWLAILGFVIALGMFFLPLIATPTGYGFPVWVMVVSFTILAVRPRKREVEAVTAVG
ncbi:MAG: hypothetical protein ACR2O6_10360 [Ilumatobacteraceae bacterium]